MLVLAAAVLLSARPCRAQVHAPARALVSRLLSVISDTPINRLLECSQTIGAGQCVNALSLWCVENAVDVYSKGGTAQFNLTSDLENFQWEHFRNGSEEITYLKLCDETEKLLQYRSLELFLYPNYKLQLGSKGNGVLSVDILKDEVASRSNKKLRKQFYNIVPYLLLPGLIMSAILPFVLPALKLMTVGAGMLNNMALTGAVFTLLRNNAFNDKYNHKLVYVNEGYENEKIYKSHDKFNTHELQKTDEESEGLEEIPSGSYWIDQYYGRKEHVRTEKKKDKPT